MKFIHYKEHLYKYTDKAFTANHNSRITDATTFVLSVYRSCREKMKQQEFPSIAVLDDSSRFFVLKEKEKAGRE